MSNLLTSKLFVYAILHRNKFWSLHPLCAVARLLGTAGVLPISPRTVRKTSLTQLVSNKKNDTTDGKQMRSATTRAFSTATLSQSNNSRGLQGILQGSNKYGIRDRMALLR